MKKTVLALAASAAIMMTGSVFAQTCTPSAAAPVLGGAQSGQVVNFDTCAASDQLVAVCSGANSIGTATDAIFRVNVGPGAHSGSFNIATTNAAYDLYAGLIQGACSGAGFCPLEADGAGAGGAETLGPIDALANGEYYLIVTTFAAGCGPVAITVPTLPVALQQFSVD